MNQLRMSQGITGKGLASPGGIEKLVWNRCSYQFSEMVGTNARRVPQNFVTTY